MSSVTREQAMTALFTLLSTIQIQSGSPPVNTNLFVYSSRIVKLWGDVPLTDRPSMMLGDHEDYYESQKNIIRPRIRTIDTTVFIYINAKDQTTPGSIQLNNILDAIDDALSPTANTGRQTLGGLVYNTWIDGKVTKVPGDLDGDGLLLIPIKICLP